MSEEHKALARARAVVLDAVDVVALISKGDNEAADAALKALFLSVDGVRQALPSRQPEAPALAPGKQVQLGLEGWNHA